MSNEHIWFEEIPNDTKLLEEARKLGIKVEEHLCPCEACQRSAQLCTATRSSLMLEIEARTNAA